MAKSSKVRVGIDLGGTKMYAVVLNEEGEVMRQGGSPDDEELEKCSRAFQQVPIPDKVMEGIVPV